MYINYRYGLIPNMSTKEVLDYTLENNEKAIVTIGIINGDEISYKVYGNNGIELPQFEYEYEIGSITKTFTAALMAKGIEEGDFNLSDSVDKYLELDNKYYPSIEKFLTHTSGYKSYYLDFDMVKNMFSGINALSGISGEKLINQLKNRAVENKHQKMEYSNFGIAIMGEVLENKYSRTYRIMMTDFIINDLGLMNTRVSDGTGNMSGYWYWDMNDGYIPAGGIISTITDMLEYTKLYLDGEISYLNMTLNKFSEVTIHIKSLEMMGIETDAVGMTWLLDETNNLIWHNGGTGKFNSYLAFDPVKKLGVVVLSNLSPNEKIPATVLGYKIIRDLQKNN